MPRLIALIARPTIAWGLAALALLAGFADLYRGGESFAPVALILAWCVLLPWAIYVGAKDNLAAASAHRPSYAAAAIAAGLVFLLYVATLAPSTAMWDTSEYLAAAYGLGFPHPPGNPFFVILGRVFSLLPIASTVAVRVNLLAALCSAASAGLWFLVAERVLASWFPARWLQLVGAATATLLGATAFTVWNQSVVNEKVYTVSLLFLALVSWLVVRWTDQPDGARADRTLLLVAYLLGLGYANHMAGMLAAPAVGLAVLARRPGTLLHWRLLLAGAAAVVLGLTPFLAQPIRAAFHPPINEGEVTACAYGPKLDCTLSRETYDRFMYNFTRKQYDKPDLSIRQAPFSGQIGMWWLYFKWQWLRDPHGEHAGLQSGLAMLFLLLGLLGGYLHWTHHRRTFWYFGPLVFTMTLGLIYYLNFKYGYSVAPELGNSVAREVRDRDYFYLWSFSAWGVWAALGLVEIWRRLAQAFVKAAHPHLGWAIAAPVLAVALVPLSVNWHAASRAGQTFTRDWARDLLNSVEPYGILVTGGDNDTFPLWYAQEVEGIRKDVTVAVVSLLQTDWYVRQLIRRPVYQYDAAAGPAIYRNRQWPRPTQPVMKLTIAQADQIPIGVRLPGQQVFQKDSIIAPITRDAIFRDELVVLQMIKDSFPYRGVFFSRGNANYGDQLGLRPYLVTQGFVRKLMPGAITPASGLQNIRGLGWFDQARTGLLWNDVYTGQRSLIAQGDWVDPASLNTPILYTITGAILAQSLQQSGQPAEAERTMATAEQIARAMRVEKLLGL